MKEEKPRFNSITDCYNHLAKDRLYIAQNPSRTEQGCEPGQRSRRWGLGRPHKPGWTTKQFSRVASCWRSVSLYGCEKSSRPSDPPPRFRKNRRIRNTTLDTTTSSDTVDKPSAPDHSDPRCRPKASY